MTATTRRLRIPSSGPFLTPDNPDGPPPEVGEGTPGRIYRFLGDTVPQVFPNAGPTQQLINFRSYDGTLADSSPAFPEPLEVPFWCDFELYLEFLDWPTTTCDIRLQMTHQFGLATPRFWNIFTGGTTEQVGILIADRQLYFPDVGEPNLLYSSFQVLADLAGDAADVTLNNPQCYAKFQLYAGNPAP